MNSWEEIPSNTRHKWTNATQYMQYQYSVLSRNKFLGAKVGRMKLKCTQGKAVLYFEFFLWGGGGGKVKF